MNEARRDPASVTVARSAATVLVVTSLFLGRLIDGFYQGLGRAAPRSLPILVAIFMVSSLYAWFWSYSQEHRITSVMDMGWFLFSAWIVLLPYYILKTEGRAGWSCIGLFCLTYVAAFAAGWATLIWTQLIFH